MGTSDLFRNLQWQIETHLVPKTIEHLRKNWTWDISPEENLNRAVTSVVPFIFECHNRWGEHMAEIMNNDYEGQGVEDETVEVGNDEEIVVYKTSLQVLKDFFKESQDEINAKYQLD